MKAYSFIIVFVSLVYGSPLLADLIEKGSANFVNRNSDVDCESREINAGCIRAANDLSAIGRVGPYLVIGGDEAVGPDKNLNIVQVLSRQEDGQYVVGDDILLADVDKKDGGELDIEGIAVDDGWLYVGFRGPVFRDNYVPVLKLKFDQHEKSAKLLFVKLDGGGIRDMVPGKDRDDTKGYIRKLGNIDVSKGKAEGILALEIERGADDDCQYKFMIIFDGVINGNPKIYCSSKD